MHIFSRNPIAKANPTHRNAWVETLESRAMKSVTYVDDNTNSDQGGTYFGAVLFGDNGDASGMPTAYAGQSDGAAGWAFLPWDGDLSNGVDSPIVPTVFSLNVDGSHQANWTVENQDAGTFSVGSSIQVHSVTIQAEVTGSGMAFDWSDVKIDFYHAGAIVETVNLKDIHANTLNSTNGAPAEALAVVTPTASGVDGVRVTASAHLQTNAGTYPGWTDVAGQVFVS